MAVHIDARRGPGRANGRTVGCRTKPTCCAWRRSAAGAARAGDLAGGRGGAPGRAGGLAAVTLLHMVDLSALASMVGRLHRADLLASLAIGLLRVVELLARQAVAPLPVAELVAGPRAAARGRAAGLVGGRAAAGG